ncbi:hypothetical protein EJ02DRAFT_483852 [Clathrospora elynae]|uniref:F-box domain-containing protein n=1 Tax=Clathrospora elynae TaxID=706981 RepID=A0A6A5STL7_9PLEO|nr:hypothetical protein EJ02DRAFT_483852 [Clathrospora elynae]
MNAPPHPRGHCFSFYSFLNLPRELRDKIYNFAMTTLPTRLIITQHSKISDSVLYPQALPSIFFTSKQLQRESLPIFLSRTRIVFSQPCVKQLFAFCSFVSQFPNAFAAIRMLSFHDVLWYGEAEFPGEFYPEALVSRCTGLGCLVLETHIRALLRMPMSVREHGVGVLRPYTKEEVGDMWGFEGLFGMKKLARLRLRCLMGSRAVRKLGLEGPGESVENFGEVLREGLR